MSVVDDQTRKEIEAGGALLAALTAAIAPFTGAAAPAIAALSPELPGLIATILAITNATGADPTTATRALLAQATAADPGSFKDAADEIDRKNLERIHAANAAAATAAKKTP